MKFDYTRGFFGAFIGAWIWILVATAIRTFKYFMYHIIDDIIFNLSILLIFSLIGFIIGGFLLPENKY